MFWQANCALVQFAKWTLHSSIDWKDLAKDRRWLRANWQLEAVHCVRKAEPQRAKRQAITQ
jgi:hypothetical protein